MPLFKKAVVVLCIATTSARATAGSYDFGNTCSFRGGFTQRALDQAQALRKALEQLNKEKSCTAALAEVEPQMAYAVRELGGDSSQTASGTAPVSGANNIDRMGNLPSELSALRKFAASSNAQNPQIAALILKKKLEAASLVAAESDKGLPGGKASQVHENIQAIGGEGHKYRESDAFGSSSLGRRAEIGMSAGLSVINAVLPVLAQNDECLFGSTNAGIPLLAAAVETLGSFLTGDTGGIGKQLGTSIHAMSQLLRRKKVSEALRNLNKTELNLSVECVIANATANHCSMVDDELLLRKELSEMVKGSKKRADPDGNNPLSGLYVLMRDVPKVTAWLTKIRTGVEPQWEQDAQRSQTIIQAVTTTYSTDLAVRATYNQQSITLKRIDPLLARKTFIVAMMRTIVQKIGGGGVMGLGGAGSETNFFMFKTTPLMLPFKLAGMTAVPPKVMPGTENRVQVMSWEQWFENDPEAYQKFFSTREASNALMVSIKQGIDEISSLAFDEVGNYFINLMAVDPLHLVVEAGIGPGVSVVASLTNIRNYLGHLHSVSKKNPARAGSLELIASTYHRVDEVLKQFNNFSPQELQNLAKPDVLKQSDADMVLKARQVIDSAYKNFNVLLQFDSFFHRRLPALVRDDLERRTKESSEVNQYYKDLLVSSGTDLIDRMKRLTGKDQLLHITQDLESGIAASWDNLRVVEQSFSGLIYPRLEELQLAASGREVTWKALNALSAKRKARDEANPLKKERESRFWGLDNLATTLIGPDQDRYNAISSAEGFTPYRETESRLYGHLLARFCAQTLSFSDPGKYKEFCAGTVQVGPLEPKRLQDSPNEEPLVLEYDHYTTGSRAPLYLSSAYRQDALCANYRFGIRNKVYAMLAATATEEDRDKEQKFIPPPVFASVAGDTGVVMNDLLAKGKALATDGKAQPVQNDKSMIGEKKPGETETGKKIDLQSAPKPQKLFPLT